MMRFLLYVCLLLPLLVGCVSETVKSTSVPTLEAPERLTPEAELLDVGIVILDPGIGTVVDDELVYPEVRKAEATFMATELAEVLNEQGGWGCRQGGTGRQTIFRPSCARHHPPLRRRVTAAQNSSQRCPRHCLAGQELSRCH